MFLRIVFENCGPPQLTHRQTYGQRAHVVAGSARALQTSTATAPLQSLVQPSRQPDQDTQGTEAGEGPAAHKKTMDP